MPLPDLNDYEVESIRFVSDPSDLIDAIAIEKSLSSDGDQYVVARLRPLGSSPDSQFFTPENIQRMFGPGIVKSESRAKPGWDESKVVRDDIGRFAEKEVMAAAANNKGSAAALFSRVTRPTERAKLEDNLQELGMSESDMNEARASADAVATETPQAQERKIKPKKPTVENWDPGWRGEVAGKEFIDARNKSKYAEFLSPISPEDLDGHVLLLSNDGTVGAAVSPEGDIQNVFNNGGPRGAGGEAIIAAVGKGGKTLDCYDGYLPSNYANFGFSETNRMAFNREYAPDNWDFEKFGEPDVVFMARTQDLSDQEMRDNVRRDKSEWAVPARSDEFTDDWDAAKQRSVELAVGARANESVADQADGPGTDGTGDQPSDSSTGRVLVLLEQGMGIPRSEMPQVQSADREELYHWLESEGVKVEQRPVDPSSLLPVQGELNQGKVDGMLESDKIGTLDVSRKPIMVSSDDYLMDGHHRWAAAIRAGKQMTGDVVDLPAKDLLEKIREFPKTFSEGLDVNRGKQQYEKYAPESAQRFTVVDPLGSDTLNRYSINRDAANPQWHPDRQELHSEITKSIIGNAQPVPEGEQPVGIVMGGGPAAGKSSILKSGDVTLPQQLVTIDSDHIKSLIPEYAEMQSGEAFGTDKAASFAHEESSWLSKRILAESVATRRNTLLDGTGNNKYESLKRKVEKLRGSGNKIVGQYVTVDTEEAVRRSMKRAQTTGRMVPESIIRKTHRGVSEVLPRAAKEGLFDEWQLWDTGAGEAPLLVAEGKGQDGKVANRELWRAFVAKAGEEALEQYGNLFGA